MEYFSSLYYSLGGVFFAFVHIVQLYMKMNPNDIPEEESSLEDPEIAKNRMFAFATTAIAWGEILVIASTSGISKVAYEQLPNIIHLYNEIFSYNQTIMDFLKHRNINFDRQHKKSMRTLERIVFATNVGSVIICLLILITCLHPLEPTHVLIKEWFEIDWNLELKFIPFIFLFTVSIQHVGNLILIYGLLVEIYCFLVTGVLNDLTVESVHIRQGSRCSLETRYFGILEDDEICKLYRIQRYLNERVNEIMGSVFISFHQIGMLATVSIMLFFFVKFQNVIWEVGPIACAVVVGSMLTPLLILWYQSQFFGVLVDTSDEFRENAMNIVPRKTRFRRFAYSCQTYYVEEAYPFFHYHKNTFLEFCETGIDYAINLMFW